MKKCFLDLETTGFDAQNDSIIEIAFIIENADGTTTEYDKLVIPTKSALTPIVTNITNITNEELEANGNDWEVLKPTVQELLTGCTIIGHNIGFDIGFLLANGIEIDPANYIDTHQLARIVFFQASSYSLESLSQGFDINHENAHRAMADVRANKELYDQILIAIEAMPSVALKAIRPLLQTTEWVAKELFLTATGTNVSAERVVTEKETPMAVTAVSPPVSTPSWSPLTYAKTDIPQMQGIAKAITDAGEKALIVTPRIGFFPGMKPFPTPDVLLDPEKLSVFSAEPLDDKRLVFALKCWLRHVHGYRGKSFFDLFFQEADLWESVQMENKPGGAYDAIKTEKLAESVLTISPRAYVRYKDWFADRAIIIDEGEVSVQQMLMSETNRVSLWKWLETKESETQALFLVAAIVRDIIEFLLRRPVGTYPEKVPVPNDFSLQGIIPQLEALGVFLDYPALKQVLLQPTADTRRWIEYHPQSGNIQFCWWSGAQWEATQKSLEDQELYFFCRLNPERVSFIRHWTGLQLSGQEDFPTAPIQFTPGLPSVNAFNFVPRTIDAVLDLRANQGSKKTVITVSSRDFLQNLYYELLDRNLTNIEIYAERISGGDGKIHEKMQHSERFIYLHHRSSKSSLETINADLVAVPKFPFSAPNPLIQHFEQEQNLWDIYTIPFTATQLLRRAYAFGTAPVYILDPRSNKGWGKSLLDLFPHS